MSQPRHPSHPKSKPKAKPQPPRTDWTQVADWYDKLVGDEGSEFHREVVLPGTLKLLAMQAGERVLDVACGQGVLCRLLHAGKANVTGIDSAKPLIDAAVQRSDKAIRYLTGDARELEKHADLAGKFNAAACVLAIANINPIRPVFEGIAKCLVDDGSGRAVVVMNHPAFRGPPFTHWGWDEKEGVQYRRVDRYLEPRKQPIVTHPGKDPGKYTWTFHRPISVYVKALRQAGLLVDAIEEWASHKVSDSGPRAKAENVARAEIPMFLAIRAVKIAMSGQGGHESVKRT
jgi:SAM-dependent methyltransferase